MAYTLRWGTLVLLGGILTGCAATTPHEIFQAATSAFSEGDIATGMGHFSERLKAARPATVLEDYYSREENRRGVQFFLREASFRVVHESETHIVARVTWTTGRSEPVYFVRENGRWKLDLPPSPERSPAPAVGTDPKSPASSSGS